MSKATNILKIKFIDGEELVISDVEDWGETDSGDYYLTRFGFDTYFSAKQIKYIGRKFDLDNEQRGAWS